MQTSQDWVRISPETLYQWMKTGRPFILTDTLTPDHFEKVHLPGAKNACVFEVTFEDQISAITTDKQAEIVLYGASDSSVEAVVAGEKLQRAGYAKLHILKGGIRAWLAAGYALEGPLADAPPTPENRLSLRDGSYRVDINESTLEWAGRNPNTKHDGNLRLSNGQIRIKDGRLTGTFEIDMQAIENKSLTGDELQPVLVAHLKSDDFFFSKLFPTTLFSIREARPRTEAYLSAPNVDVKGELTLRGIKADLDFAATVVQSPDGIVTARAHFDLDRTRWNIIYGSTRFFEHLGMHLVFDDISIDLKIIAEKVG
jgi:polyisoprenoid-binding protein YceI